MSDVTQAPDARVPPAPRIGCERRPLLALVAYC